MGPKSKSHINDPAFNGPDVHKHICWNTYAHINKHKVVYGTIMDLFG